MPKTPYDLWVSRKPILNYLHVSSCRAEDKILNPQSKKLDPRTISCYFIGYPHISKDFRFCCPTRTTRIVENRYVVFLEDVDVLFTCLGLVEQAHTLVNIYYFAYFLSKCSWGRLSSSFCVSSLHALAKFCLYACNSVDDAFLQNLITLGHLKLVLEQVRRNNLSLL